MDRLPEIILRAYFPRIYQEKILAYMDEQMLSVKQRATMAIRLTGLWEVNIFGLGELDALLPCPELVTLSEEQERALDEMSAVLVELDGSAKLDQKGD